MKCVRQFSRGCWSVGRTRQILYILDRRAVVTNYVALITSVRFSVCLMYTLRSIFSK